MSEIHLQVVAGLANRIRALVSGICLAEEYGLPLVLHWSIDHACGARFETLFDPTSLPPFVRITHLALLKAFPCLSSDDLEHVKKVWDRKLPLTLKSYGHFHTSDMPRWLQHLRALKPTEEILKTLQERLPPFDPDTFVGVHIRRGDNDKAILASPFSLFLTKLEKEEGLLIVATDDMDVREELGYKFKGRVWFPSKVLNRNTEEGMKEALIDFLALATCRRILGSACSSFNEIACLYGACTLERVT